MVQNLSMGKWSEISEWMEFLNGKVKENVYFWTWHCHANNLGCILSVYNTICLLFVFKYIFVPYIFITWEKSVNIPWKSDLVISGQVNGKTSCFKLITANHCVTIGTTTSNNTIQIHFVLTRVCYWELVWGITVFAANTTEMYVY